MKELNENEKIILINLIQHEIDYTADEIDKTQDKELKRYSDELDVLIKKIRESL